MDSLRLPDRGLIGLSVCLCIKVGKERQKAYEDSSSKISRFRVTGAVSNVRQVWPV